MRVYNTDKKALHELTSLFGLNSTIKCVYFKFKINIINKICFKNCI